ncbi:MAG: hypothetical protein LBH00_12790 [Planctomycetaceae bacterium]|jgi:transcription-repair coupling factor (superfamily II helicase)|nr:hypothetical protein [Planctomycetaceae bacterium]
MPLSDLWQYLHQYEPFAAAAASFRGGQPVSIDGAAGSSAAFAAVALGQSFFRDGHKTLLVAAATEESAERAAGDMEVFVENTAGNNVRVFYFPPLATEEEAGTHAAAGSAGDGERLRILKHLLSGTGQPCVIAASMPALQQHVPPPEILKKSTQILAVNDRVDMTQFCRNLADNGFHAAAATALPGEFAVRGYILDIFAPDWNLPVRIEFFDDTVESIRRFDPATQRSLEQVPEIDLTLLRSCSTAGASLLDYLPEDVPVVWLPESLPDGRGFSV